MTTLTAKVTSCEAITNSENGARQYAAVLTYTTSDDEVVHQEKVLVDATAYPTAVDAKAQIATVARGTIARLQDAGKVAEGLVGMVVA